MYKMHITFIISTLFFITSINAVSAQTPTVTDIPQTQVTETAAPTDTQRQKGKKADLNADVRNVQRIPKLKDKATKEITRRVERLTKLLNRLLEMKRLSDTQKAALTKDISDTINNLKQQQDVINADTDITLLRQHVREIRDNYRIYALYMPKMHILVGADVITQLSTKLSEIAQKRGVSDQGVQSHLTTAQTKAQEATNAVLGLSPSGYPANKPTLQQARLLLKEARDELKKAREIIASQKDTQKDSVIISPTVSQVTPSVSQQITQTPTVAQ
jgi:hypothetical protein